VTTQRNHGARSLRLEPLERRDMMAGIAAKLSRGVLTVNGTDKADYVNFRQTNGWITIDNVKGGWGAAQVNSIVVNLKGGNDFVAINGLTEQLHLISGKGWECVRLSNGKDVWFSGKGHTLSQWAPGIVTLDMQYVQFEPPQPPPPPPPPTGNWFDANVVDAALRTLGSSLYADNQINRADLLALFDSAEDNGTVDGTELNDLRAIANNTTLFGGAEHLWKLSSYVVTASAANSTFQGQALGNLAAGSTAEHLDKLVSKWFLGADRPAASGTYRQFTGQLFVGGASYTDIKQGYVGDCYFMASLAEVAQQNASIITNMFVVNGDGTYTVKFFNNGVSHYVTADSYLPTNGSGQAIYAGLGAMYNNAGAELWTMLAEKAYVQLNQFGWIRAGLPGNGQNAYSAIEGGYIYAALGHVSGQATVAFAMTSSGTSFSTFVSAYNAGKMIGFASKGAPASPSVVGGHAYTVASYDGTTQKVTLFNPWGTQYAMLTLSWAEVQANFSYFDRTA